MIPVSWLHRMAVLDRRAGILAAHVAPLVPDGAAVLDVGSGDGLIDRLIRERRPDVTIRGIDPLVRPKTHIPVTAFDGGRIPFGDASFDVVMFIDVLHHTADPEILLREGRRVARTAMILKDHTCDGFLADARLRFMDRIGNAGHGVPLPYNYWPERRWHDAFERIGLKPLVWRKRLGLYPAPANWLFDSSLHFIARLEPD